MILNITEPQAILRPMKKLPLLIPATLVLMASAASAECYADYKAKRDKPLRLHYGVMELPQAACRSKALAKDEIAARLATKNWKVLNVLSIFDQDGLDERQKSAGKYFLRF